MLLETLNLTRTREGAHKATKRRHGVDNVLFLDHSEVEELIKSLVEVVQYSRQILARLLTGHGVFQTLLVLKKKFFFEKKGKKIESMYESTEIFVDVGINFFFRFFLKLKK